MTRAPLEGIRVLAEDASLAGMLIARHLGDMGAEVAILFHRPAAPLRNVFSAAGADLATRDHLLAGADVWVVTDARSESAPSPRTIVVAAPGDIDETTDLPWLVSIAATGALGVALFARRRDGIGRRIAFDLDALRALLRAPHDVGTTAPQPWPANGHPPPREEIDRHLRERGFFEPVGDVEMRASPWLIGGNWAHTRLPAPAPGEHVEELARRFQA